MMCAWDSLLKIVPQQIRGDVDKYGRYTMQELRLRLGSPPEIVTNIESIWLDYACTKEDIGYCVQAGSRYSPWGRESVKKGYLTAPGGHRVGICGLSLYKNGKPTGIRDITSVCIRVARDFPGIAKNVPGDGSVIILGAPGWGKTTLLRDLIRMRSEYKRVCVVDERGELFPEGLDTGKRTDILRGCQKCHGIEQVLRTMGPGCIAVDEITASEDCACLIRSAGCGAELLATAHAETIRAFHSHPIYRSLIHSGIFQWILMLRPDKQFSIERMVS